MDIYYATVGSADSAAALASAGSGGPAIVMESQARVPEPLVGSELAEDGMSKRI
jgi:hypothetical protein